MCVREGILLSLLKSQTKPIKDFQVYLKVEIRSLAQSVESVFNTMGVSYTFLESVFSNKVGEIFTFVVTCIQQTESISIK